MTESSLDVFVNTVLYNLPAPGNFVKLKARVTYESGEQQYSKLVTMRGKISKASKEEGISGFFYSSTTRQTYLGVIPFKEVLEINKMPLTKYYKKELSKKFPEEKF